MSCLRVRSIVASFTKSALGLPSVISKAMRASLAAWCSERATQPESSSAAGIRLNRLVIVVAPPRGSWMKDQLLHSPVEQLADVENILRWTSDLVDPSELPELLARFAQHSQDLALEAQLVDAPRKGVGGVDHLVR